MVFKLDKEIFLRALDIVKYKRGIVFTNRVLRTIIHGDSIMDSDYQITIDEIQRLLKEKTKRFAFKKLEREVIKTGACVECGACVAGCPVGAITGERVDDKYVPKLTGECTSCGICYAMCPRSFVLEEQLIGSFKSVWKIRTLESQNHQDGGAVTSILGYMLVKKMIDGAVVACYSAEKPWMPIAKTVTNKDDLYKCGGTIYTHAQVVDELTQGLKKNLSSLAIVGTACNIDAVHRMEEHPAGFFSINQKASVFKISLFCTESFNYRDLVSFLDKAGIDIKTVTRFAIASGQFKVSVGSEEHSWPVGELDTAAASSCAFCQDFTGKYSDLSCGNIGSDEGWTTVLARTDRGVKIVKEALKAGAIEGEKIEADAVLSVMNSARFKMNKYYGLSTKH
jgi:coenzyme F420 hydrogenase subunit beta